MGLLTRMFFEEEVQALITQRPLTDDIDLLLPKLYSTNYKCAVVSNFHEYRLL